MNLRARLGAHPINWSNDDFPDLGGDTSLETCLMETREAGYEGTELGHKFPKDPEKLKPILNRHGLALISGWHSTYLASKNYESEERDFRGHLEFLAAMGCRVVIAAECSGRVYHDPKTPLDWTLSNDEWNRVFRGLDSFARIARDRGLKLVYHHHMGTAIQNGNEIDRLMENTRDVSLLGDTGHLALAGEDPLAVFTRYRDRLGHVHLKNVRPAVVDRARAERHTFERAVKDGVFTVPGDGGIDYVPIFALLERIGYEGWMVVEAEQDPKKANPLQYAMKARKYLKTETGL